MLFTKMQDTLVLVYKALKADDVVKEKIKGIQRTPHALSAATAAVNMYFACIMRKARKRFISMTTAT